jgi:chorismate--pyruvate lyase
LINILSAVHNEIADDPLAINWKQPDEVQIEDNYLRNWLLDTGSLTERLQSMCRQFQVHVICHQKAIPFPDEIQLLNCEPSSTFIREVILLGDSMPWVYARSVIPKAINDVELSELGNQPLGKRIFNDTRFSRGEFQLCHLQWADIAKSVSLRAPELSESLAKMSRQGVFGRRSCFEFLGSHMSVAEVFLPQAPAYEN